MKIYIFTSFLLFQLFGICQDNIKTNASYIDDFLVGETIYNNEDTGVVKIINFLKNYTKYALKDPYYKSNYWSTKAKSYSIPDYFLKSELAEYSSFDIQTNLVYIHKRDSFWVTQLAYQLYKNNSFKGTACVYNYIVTIENGNLKLCPYIEFLNFNLNKNKNITIYTSKNIVLNDNQLDSLNNYNKYLSDFFKLPIKKFDCYIFNNFSELNASIGLDLHINPNIVFNNAYSDFYNNKLYLSSLDSYFHELTHLYTNQQYPNRHYWFDEGLALMLGGSNAKNINYHLSQLKKHLTTNTFTYSSQYINETTNYKVDVGALICLKVYEKYGFKGINRLLKYGNNEFAFFAAISDELGINKDNITEYLRKVLEKY